MLNYIYIGMYSCLKTNNKLPEKNKINDTIETKEHSFHC